MIRHLIGYIRRRRCGHIGLVKYQDHNELLPCTRRINHKGDHLTTTGDFF